MFEKVNPAHPDKVADRIAGALVDLAYEMEENPKIAVEVLIGHGVCNIITETSVKLPKEKVGQAVSRIAGRQTLNYIEVPQDAYLAHNQEGTIRCGDNGIFKGTPTTAEQLHLTRTVRALYEDYPTDGKYILADGVYTVCQSQAQRDELFLYFPKDSIINPLGYWEGGTDTDSGATNRKLGSDMGDAVTGGGLHGKDLSKADVSLNIYAHILANEKKVPVELHCSIGDEYVNGLPYSEIVDMARTYIKLVGGFEKFAEWGIIR